jgi:transposase
LIAGCGHEVIVANSRELRLIFKNPKKSDRIDAENLARTARLDPKLLHPVEHRSAEIQIDLALLRARDCLVASRTKLINHIRGAVKSIGGRLPCSSAASFNTKAPESIPEALKPVLNPLIETIAKLTDQIHRYDKTIGKELGAKYPVTETLKQVSGVGPLTALAFVLIIGDPRRFSKGRNVGPYLGLTPKKDQTGEQDPQLRISKAGDGFLRRLLVGSAQYILGPFGPDTDLRRFGTEIARRGGKNAKKRAVVAVARKLAVLLHRLWLTGEVYEPLRWSNKKKHRATTTPQPEVK